MLFCGLKAESGWKVYVHTSTRLLSPVRYPVISMWLIRSGKYQYLAKALCIYLFIYLNVFIIYVKMYVLLNIWFNI